jgi:outer membrane protein assembly factor BamE (lipoprotein component of BamABCDE complex)
MKYIIKDFLACLYRILSVMGLGIVIVGCATADKDRNSNFTHGNVQRVLKKGITTQQQVIEVFGAPNITTTDADNNEVWTYQKHSVGGESLDAGGGVIGVVPGAVGVGGTSGSAYSQSSKTMTLIIKFDEKNIVRDFQSMYSSF